MDRTEHFLRLWADVEHQIYRYVFTLVRNRQDTQDIVQETSVALWRKLDQYDPARPFAAWASRFAYLQVLKFREAHPHREVNLNDETLRLVAEDFVALRDQLDAQSEALAECLEKLPVPARDLVDKRYADGLTVQEIARRSQRSVHSLYKRLTQIRCWLDECVQTTVEREGAA